LKILHVSQPVEAGVAAVTLSLVEDQRDRGWSPQLACPPNGWLADSARRAGVSVHPWRATRALGANSVAETISLHRLIRHIRPDVLHLHSSKAGLAGRLATRGRVPTAFQPHMWSFLAAQGPIGRASRWWERLAARWTHQLICVSDDELAIGRGAGVHAPAVVVPNGVDTEHFVPGDRQVAREQLGLGGGPIALCVGRMAQQKGQDLLLTAWPSVLSRLPHARLVLVGDGPMATQWREAHPVGRHSSVLWRDACAPADYYTAADVVVLPSRAEGMALVPLEAMASGRSVVAFDVGGARQSIGDAGTVLRANDIEGLADAVADRLSKPELAEAEGDSGRERAITSFARKRVSDHIAEVVAGLVHRDG
jgi:glycosyltransferase involved in cell wall biosynthesis